MENSTSDVQNCLKIFLVVKKHRRYHFYIAPFFRYISLNVQYSSGYRTYNKDVPDFLQNRPRFVVEHVMKRWQDIWHEHGNVQTKEEGKFLVQSTTSPGHWYTVNFGDESSHPSCDCLDWNKSKLLCKHFCAVFQLLTRVGVISARCIRICPF